MGFPHISFQLSLQLDPSSRGWDHSPVPSPRIHRHPAQTATSRVGLGCPTTTRLESATIIRHNKTFSDTKVPTVPLALSSNPPYHNWSTQLHTGPRSHEVPDSILLAGRTAVPAIVQLETTDARRMGSEHCIWVENRAHGHSNTNLQASDNLSTLKAKGAIIPVSNTIPERRDVFFSTGTQENETSDQLQRPQQVCQNISFQDGGCPIHERPVAEIQLGGESILRTHTFQSQNTQLTNSS